MDVFVNLERVVNERFGEFWGAATGVVGEAQVPGSTPACLSRNGAGGQRTRRVVKPLGKATKRKTPNPVGARRGALTYGWFLFVENELAPRNRLETETHWSTAAEFRNVPAHRPPRGRLCEFRFDQGRCWGIECDDATRGIPALLGRHQRSAREV
jgi:hypothetical protein